jgi:signal peptidase II
MHICAFSARLTRRRTCSREVEVPKPHSSSSPIRSLLFRRPSANSIYLVLVAILVILADQASKILVEKRMELGQSIPIVTDFFRLTFVRNAGGAFGISLGGEWFYFVASIVAIVFILLYFRRMSAMGAGPRGSLAMILGGALGNLVDRLRCGTVTDFLDFGIGRLRWPVFNLADAAVTVGVVVFLLSLLQKKAEDRGEDKASDRSQPD